MIKKIFIMFLASVFLSGCSLAPKKSGLEIMSYPMAKVYINGKEMGSTPYKNLDLKPGENQIRLVTSTRELTKKLDLQNNINTVVDWQFGEGEDQDSGYVLYLEKTGDKKASLLVNTAPDKGTISIDGIIKGLSPIKVIQLDEGDRQLTVSSPGYKSVNVFMKSISGYQLIVETKLAKEKDNNEMLPQDQDKTPNNLSVAQTNKITIKETETGWLKVRENNSASAKEITKVKPGESYPLLKEEKDWYQIDLGDNKSGWVSTNYASKSE